MSIRVSKAANVLHGVPTLQWAVSCHFGGVGLPPDPLNFTTFTMHNFLGLAFSLSPFLDCVGGMVNGDPMKLEGFPMYRTNVVHDHHTGNITYYMHSKIKANMVKTPTKLSNSLSGCGALLWQCQPLHLNHVMEGGKLRCFGGSG